MTKARLLIAVSLLGIAVTATMLNGCGKSGGSSTKFTIIGAGE